MVEYFVKRLLLFLPTLLLVSLVAFFLSRMAPGDPVMKYLVNDPFGTISTPQDLYNAERACQQAAAVLQLDKPGFYFSVNSAACPDTLYRIPVGFRKKSMVALLRQWGNWPLVQEYYSHIRRLDLKILEAADSLRSAAAPVLPVLRELYTTAEAPAIRSRLAKLKEMAAGDAMLAAWLSSNLDSLQKKYARLEREATPWKHWVPTFRWHGPDNQYHNWVSGFVRGNFGISLYERMPVGRKVKPALFWTVHLNLMAILLAFGIAIPLGVWSAVRKGRTTDRGITLGLFMLYSLPAFWVGTLLLIFFATPTYGMKLFAGPGLGAVRGTMGYWEQLKAAAAHLLLPIICIAYPALAFIAKQVRGSMVEALNQDYVRTARAKGLPERVVVWRHAFRNALFPIITLIASVFPAAIAGSVAIEFIFNIPGMGWLTLHAILQNDWPVVFTVLMLGAVLTIAGMLVADVLYALADPRVRFGSRVS